LLLKSQQQLLKLIAPAISIIDINALAATNNFFRVPSGLSSTVMDVKTILVFLLTWTASNQGEIP